MSGSISSMENDDDDARGDCKLSALPSVMRCDDPILDTLYAWQREISPALPRVDQLINPAHRHSPFGDLNEDGTTTPTDGNSSDFGKNQFPSPLKMPYDDILGTNDAEEGCADARSLPTTSSFFPPRVARPSLDDRHHGHATATSACALELNHVNHSVQRTTNNSAGGIIAFDWSANQGTRTCASMTKASGLSPFAGDGRYHSNSASAAAKANYDSPRLTLTSSTPSAPMSMGDSQPPLSFGSRFQSKVAEHPAPYGVAAEDHILMSKDQFQYRTEDASFKTSNAQSEGYGHLLCPLNGAVKAAHANHAKAAVASPAMESTSTIHPPTTATVMSSEEESDDRSEKRKSAWEEKFELLKKYKYEHNGSCDVPQKHPLGAWVNKVSLTLHFHISSSLVFFFS